MSLLFTMVGGVLLLLANHVVLSSYPVHALVSLVASFVAMSVLWLLFDAEFLALALIFVYVGAVMTLFLFMVMMLNIQSYPKSSQARPWVMVTLVCFTVGVPVVMLGFKYFAGVSYWGDWPVLLKASDQVSLPMTNTEAIAQLLYKKYAIAFITMGLLLLTAIVVAVSLVKRERRAGKAQRISEQLQVNPKDRVRLVQEIT